MSGRYFSVQRLAYYLISFALILTALYVWAGFFIPIVYGVFFAFMLKPICDRFERLFKNRVLAILLTLLTVFVVIGGVFTFFIVEINEVISQADGIVLQIQKSLEDLVIRAGTWIGFDPSESLKLMRENINGSGTTNGSVRIITTGLSTTGSLLASFSLIVIYTFLFLLYSTAIKRFFIGQFRSTSRADGVATIREIQGVATNYLGGMLTVMLILGVLNSLGLYLIGIRFALVWGFLGALLAVVPYIGTVIGGLLPTLYAFATTGTTWQPLAVVLLYATIQSVEGNFITPKVVGNSVKINALAAIISLIFGAIFWGVAGVILAIPLLAMVRVTLQHIDATKPVALLLSDDLYDHSQMFLEEYNQPRFRLNRIFQASPKVVVPPPPPAPRTSKKAQQPRHTDAKVVAKPKSK